MGGGAPTQGVVDRLVVVELGSSVVMTTALQTPSKEPDVKMAGTLSRSKMALPQVLTAIVRTKIARMFIGIPTIPIYGMVTNPVLKTMALGGVATGRQKANDVATAVEIIR